MNNLVNMLIEDTSLELEVMAAMAKDGLSTSNDRLSELGADLRMLLDLQASVEVG